MNQPEPLATPICVRLPESADREMRRLAALERRPIGSFVRNFILDHLEIEATPEERKALWEKMTPMERREAERGAKMVPDLLARPSVFTTMLKEGSFPSNLGEIPLECHERCELAPNEEEKPLTGGDSKR